MKLNHLNLTVTDVPETRKLFERYFGFTGLEKGGNDNFEIVFDDDGLVLTLMNGGEVSYPETFHIGFVQANEERVNAINQRLKDDGFDVEPPKRFHDPGHSISVRRVGLPLKFSLCRELKRIHTGSLGPSFRHINGCQRISKIGENNYANRNAARSYENY